MNEEDKVLLNIYHEAGKELNIFEKIMGYCAFFVYGFYGDLMWRIHRAAKKEETKRK